MHVGLLFYQNILFSSTKTEANKVGFSLTNVRRSKTLKIQIIGYMIGNVAGSF